MVRNGPNWPKIVSLLFHSDCNYELYTAHLSPLLQKASDAARAAVHEPSDTLCSQKAQCEAAPDNPESGDITQYRGRRCAGHAFGGRLRTRK